MVMKTLKRKEKVPESEIVQKSSRCLERLQEANEEAILDVPAWRASLKELGRQLKILEQLTKGDSTRKKKIAKLLQGVKNQLQNLDLYQKIEKFRKANEQYLKDIEGQASPEVLKKDIRNCREGVALIYGQGRHPSANIAAYDYTEKLCTDAAKDKAKREVFRKALRHPELMSGLTSAVEQEISVSTQLLHDVHRAIRRPFQ
jgi:hypothetical protein